MHRATGFAEGILRKVCGSFVADMNLIVSLRAWKSTEKQLQKKKGVA